MIKSQSEFERMNHFIKLREKNLKKIESSNQILLSKLVSINRKPSSLSKQSLVPKSTKISKSNSLNFKIRVESQNKINLENSQILKRLQAAQSVYSKDKWEDQFRKHEVIKMTHSRANLRIKRSEDRKHNRSLSRFSICEPAVFESMKRSFYEHYEQAK